MNFLYTKTRLKHFYANFKETTTKVMKKYSLHDLNNIAMDIELATGAKFSSYARDDDGCRQIIEVIKTLIKSWTSTEKGNMEKLMKQGAGQAQKKNNKKTKKEPKKEPKSVSVVSIADLRTRASEHELLTTGTRSELTQRLHRHSTDTLRIEDMSTESLRNELREQKVRVPRSREDMIVLVRRGDNDNLELEDFTDEVLDYHLDHSTQLPNSQKKNMSRDQKLKTLRIVHIKMLKQYLRQAQRELASCQKRPLKVLTRHHHHGQSGESWSGALARGIFQGVTAGVISNAITRRRLQSKKKLVF